MDFDVTPDSLRAVNPDGKHNSKIRLAIIGYRSTNMLAPFLEKSLHANGISVSLYQGQYNQVEHEVFNPDSALIAFQPDAIVLLNSLEALRKQWFIDGTKLSENTISHFNKVQEAISSHLPEAILIHENYELDYDGIFNASNEKGLVYQIRKINDKLAEFKPNQILFDKATYLSYLGLKKCRNNGMLNSVDLPYTSNTEALISWEFSRIIGSCFGRFKKCLILDLDNTLWGGIIGDDGLEGIQIGGDGNGLIYSAIQHWALGLKENGILLAICSKNTKKLAEEPFLKHPNMVLSLSDIAVFVANWSNKAENIKYIKETLNIDYNSMVFIDDNPVEREIVQQSFPDVTVPEIPEDLADVPDYLRAMNFFPIYTTSPNEFDRTNFFVQNKARNALNSETISIDDYLKSLNLKAKIAPLTSENIGRISELSMRSNQFNLRTQRYNVTELERILKDSNYAVQTVTLEDKFGSYGLIAVVVLKQMDHKSIFIENWFMSCRAIQRGVEEMMLNELVTFCKSIGIDSLIGEYLPSEKNAIVSEHFSRLGFCAIDNNCWELKIDNFTLKPTVIEIV